MLKSPKFNLTIGSNNGTVVLGDGTSATIDMPESDTKQPPYPKKPSNITDSQVVTIKNEWGEPIAKIMPNQDERSTAPTTPSTKQPTEHEDNFAKTSTKHSTPKTEQPRNQLSETQRASPIKEARTNGKLY